MLMNSTEPQLKKSQAGRKYHDLIFGVRRSIRYHTSRRQFFEAVDALTVGISLVIISSIVYLALTDWFGQEGVACLAALVTILWVLNLAFGIRKKTLLHNDLAKRFVDLEKKMIAVDEPSDEEIRQWTNERLDIEKDEPTKRIILDCIMHNEMVKAYGYPEQYLLDVKWYQAIFSQFFDLVPAAVVYVGSKQAVIK